MTNVAVIVAGQFRISESISTTIRNIGAIRHRLFITSWSQRGVKRSGWFGIPQFCRVLNYPVSLAIPPQFFGWIDDLVNLVPEFFDDLDARVRSMPTVSEDIKRLFPGAAIDIEDEALFISSNTKFVPFTNSEKMLYKILRGLSMMRREELESGEKFSHILKVRPDVAYAGGDFVILDKDKFYVDWMGMDNGVLKCGDAVMFGPRDSFEDAMLDAYRIYLSNIVDYKDMDIHQLVASVLDPQTHKIECVPSAYSNGEWPIDSFKKALANKGTTSTLARAISQNIAANEAVLDGRGHDALTALEGVPGEWAGLPGVLWARLKANELTGDVAKSVAAANNLMSLVQSNSGQLDIFREDAERRLQ